MSHETTYFTVRRRTITVYQFEFRVNYSFEYCVERLTHLDKMSDEKEIASARGIHYRPKFPTSVIVQIVDDAAEYQLTYEEVQVNGTFYPLGADTTLFVGVSRLAIEAKEPYFYLGMLAVACVAAIALFLVMSIWGILFVLMYVALLYIPARLHIEYAVQSLVDAVIPILSRR